MKNIKPIIALGIISSILINLSGCGNKQNDVATSTSQTSSESVKELSAEELLKEYEPALQSISKNRVEINLSFNLTGNDQTTTENYNIYSLVSDPDAIENSDLFFSYQIKFNNSSTSMDITSKKDDEYVYIKSASSDDESKTKSKIRDKIILNIQNSLNLQLTKPELNHSSIKSAEVKTQSNSSKVYTFTIGENTDFQEFITNYTKSFNSMLEESIMSQLTDMSKYTFNLYTDSDGHATKFDLKSDTFKIEDYEFSMQIDEIFSNDTTPVVIETPSDADSYIEV